MQICCWCLLLMSDYLKHSCLLQCDTVSLGEQFMTFSRIMMHLFSEPRRSWRLTHYNPLNVRNYSPSDTVSLPRRQGHCCDNLRSPMIRSLSVPDRPTNCITFDLPWYSLCRCPTSCITLDQKSVILETVSWPEKHHCLMMTRQPFWNFWPLLSIDVAGCPRCYNFYSPSYLRILPDGSCLVHGCFTMMFTRRTGIS